MKFYAILALVAAATAAVTPNADPAATAPQVEADGAQGNTWPPSPPQWPPRECRPGTYSCTLNKQGWRVCDYSGHWVFAGHCGWNQVCKYNWQSQSPYCVPRW